MKVRKINFKVLIYTATLEYTVITNRSYEHS